MTRIDLTLVRQLTDRADPLGVKWTGSRLQRGAIGGAA
jgi:hypothetical protein